MSYKNRREEKDQILYSQSRVDLNNIDNLNDIKENDIKEAEEVDFEQEAEKERKAMLHHFFNDVNRNPNVHVTKDILKARYHVTGSKAKSMMKVYKNQKTILFLYQERAEAEENKAALEDLLRRDPNLDAKAEKQLKNFKKRIEALEKKIAKAQQYLDKRTKEVLTEDEIRETPITEKDRERVEHIKLVSLQKENKQLHEKFDSYKNAIAALPAFIPRTDLFSRFKVWLLKKHYNKKIMEYQTKLYVNEADLRIYNVDKKNEEERLKNRVIPDWEKINKQNKQDNIDEIVNENNNINNIDNINNINNEIINENNSELNVQNNIPAIEEEKTSALITESTDEDNNNLTLGNEGDLEYHKFTGRGPGARYHAEVFDKQDTVIEKGSFKENVLKQVNEYLDHRMAKLDKQLDAQEQFVFEKIAADTLKKQQKGDMESVKNDLQLAIRFEEELKATTEQILTITGERENISKRLDNIKTKLKKVRARLANSSKKKSAYMRKYHNPDYSAALYFAKYQMCLTRFEELDKKVNLFKNGKSTEPFTKKDYDEWYKCREESKKYFEKATKASAELRKLEDKAMEMDKDIKAYQSEINELLAEEEVLKKGNPSGDRMLEFLKVKKETLEKGIKINRSSIVGYDKLLKYNETKKKLLAEKKAVSEQKLNAKNDVLAAEESNISLDDKMHSEVKAMFINDMVYFDHQELKRKGINLYNKDKSLKLNSRQLRREMEIQKIVKALKSRPIFKFLNSDTVMEYMSYDELTGKFRLAKEGLSPKEKSLYDQKLRSAFFNDDSTFVNRKIEANPGVMKAFGNLMWNGLKAAFNEGWPEGMGALGADYMFSALNNKWYNVVPELDYATPENFKGRGIDDFMRQRRMRHGVREAADLILTIADNPSVGNIFHTNCCVAINDANTNFFLKNTGFNLNALGLGAYVLDIIQFGNRIAMAQKDINKQRAEMEAMLKRHHERFATVMKAAKTESEVERMKAIVSTAFSLSRDVFLMTTGITGFVTDLASLTGKIVTKAIFSGIMRGKSNEEILNSPEVLGGIDYDKNVISEKDFDEVLASVIGIKSKKELAKAMHIINGIDLHRAAIKSEKDNVVNPEVDRSMYALGFSDKHRYHKVKVRDILFKTMGDGGEWHKNLRDTVEYKGVDYDTALTRYKKEKKGLLYYKDDAHKSRMIQNYEYKKRLINALEGESKLEFQSEEFERVKRVACMSVATDMYNAFREYELDFRGDKIDNRKNKSRIYEFIMNDENRDEIINMMSSTDIVNKRALNLSKPVTDNELYEMSKSVIKLIIPSIKTRVNKLDDMNIFIEEDKIEEDIDEINNEMEKKI